MSACISEPVREYFQPIKKRWTFHFMLSSKTSVLDKPEWYLSKTIRWLHEHIDKVEKQLGSDAKYEFILCMIECALMRLNKDIIQIQNGLKNIETEAHYEAILIHTYNEIISFVRIIRQLFGEEKYNQLDDKYDLMLTFTNKNIFERIVDIEWDHCERYFNSICAMPNAWDMVLGEEYQDPYKIPKCADKFLMLISTISERLVCFRQKDCQFKLVELQCHLIEKFYEHLKGASRSGSGVPGLTNILKLSNSLLLSKESTPEEKKCNKLISATNGTNFLRLVLKNNHLLPKDVYQNLDKGLSDKLTLLSRKYSDLYDLLSSKKDENVSNMFLETD